MWWVRTALDGWDFRIGWTTKYKPQQPVPQIDKAVLNTVEYGRSLVLLAVSNVVWGNRALTKDSGTNTLPIIVGDKQKQYKIQVQSITNVMLIMPIMLIMLIFMRIITAHFHTLNCSKCRSRGTLFSKESNRVFQSDYTLRQSTVTKVELFEFFPVCFAEVLAAPLSDAVAIWI